MYNYKKTIQEILVSFNIWLYTVFCRGQSLTSLFWDHTNLCFRISSKKIFGIWYQINSSATKTNSFLNFNTYSTLKFLKNNNLCQFKSLSDIIGLNFSSNNFILFYNLMSFRFNYRIIYQQIIGYKFQIYSKYFISVTSLYKNANWLERELWDMFGLYPIQHPDLRRILTDYGFVGHPLLKTFSFCGFKETLYLDSKKQVVYISTQLVQAARVFSFPSNL